ncbi:MAG: cofactor-independent phosphoglycerate mutase [Thermodesulfobacteriota bacterium]|nr:cofactor-independent phosphoglycerate mutase [Thermodesulfobacteriota bacterium]
MKYIILLGDGMADYSIEKLGGKTPLEFAKIPNMDRIAGEGTLGMIDTIPEGFPPGSDVANLSVLGYDPEKCYTGRGPLEAASMGVKLDHDDVAFRCNLVTLGSGEEPVMEDFTAGHITSEEAETIIYDINSELGSDISKFYPGVSYRHLFIWKGGPTSIVATPPHDISGRMVKDYLPKGNGSRKLNRLMQLSQEILKDHPVNRARLKEGKKPASSIWFWGQGRAPKMDPLTEKYNLKGGVISAVDLLNGIGIYAGLEVIHVDGATGYTDTNYIGKAQSALEALRRMDFIFVHVEAPDEMGHEGDIEGKIKAIEDFDEKVVGTILSEIHSLGDLRIVVLSDHPTPISLRTHSSDPSPFAVLSSVDGENLGEGKPFGESSAKNGGILVSPGYLLMSYFIKNWRGFIGKKRG